MSLINCPNCGKNISDKAPVCPNCNFEISSQTNKEKIKCAECGTEYSAELSFCPECGCPTENFKSKKGKKTQKRIIILLIIIGIIYFIGIQFFKSVKLMQYSANITEATQTMVDGATKAESVGNLIISVWNNAIYKKSDDTTNKYTMQNGRFVDDFNDALKKLYDDSEQNKIIMEIRDNQNSVANLMKTLKNPPKKYEEAYSALKTFYESYIKLTNMAINPNGSLSSFSEDFYKYDTDSVNAFENMKLYLD